MIGKYFRKMAFIFFIFLLVSVDFSCGKKGSGPTTGVLTFVLGKVEVSKGADFKAAQKGEIIPEGSSIRTGKGAVAILEIAKEGLKVEIQSDAEFLVKSLGKAMELRLDKGNAWTKISKTTKGQELFLKAATSVAAVRGTKFYTFYVGDIVGTCHCEGQIALGNLISKKEKTNDEDYLAFQKQGKTIYITGKDRLKAKIPMGHDHSAIDNSPLGKKAHMSPEDSAKLDKLIQEKFAALK